MSGRYGPGPCCCGTPTPPVGCPTCGCEGVALSSYGTLTDANGDHVLTASSSIQWKCAYTITVTGSVWGAATEGADCSILSTESIPLEIRYSVTCNEDDGTVTVTRNWFVTPTSPTCSYAIVADDSYSQTHCVLLSNQYRSTVAPDGCDPFAAGPMSLSPLGSPCTSDPVGGTVSFSIPTATIDCPVPCSPCPIPASDLTASWTNTGGNGSGDLVYSATGPTWQTSCVPRGTVSMTAKLECSEGGELLTVKLWSGSSSCSGTPLTFTSAPGGALTLTSSTCSPLSQTWTVDPSSGLYAAGFRTFTVTL